ncbi:MAG TPA: hypothetical protein VGC09_20055 [Rhodopila sp.]
MIWISTYCGNFAAQIKLIRSLQARGIITQQGLLSEAAQRSGRYDARNASFTAISIPTGWNRLRIVPYAPGRVGKSSMFLAARRSNVHAGLRMHRIKGLAQAAWRG